MAGWLEGWGSQAASTAIQAARRPSSNRLYRLPAPPPAGSCSKSAPLLTASPARTACLYRLPVPPACPACSKLFKEYAIADLSRHKEGRVGLRWRTQEVVSGRGQFICGAKVRGCGPAGGGCRWGALQCGAVCWSGHVCLLLWPPLQLVVAAAAAASAHSLLSAPLMLPLLLLLLSAFRRGVRSGVAWPLSKCPLLTRRQVGAGWWVPSQLLLTSPVTACCL